MTERLQAILAAMGLGAWLGYVVGFGMGKASEIYDRMMRRDYD